MRKTTEQYVYTALLAVFILTMVVVANAYAEGPELPQLLGAQYSLIAQHLFPFGAAYSGPNSLRNDGDTQKTQTFGLYAGMKVWHYLQAYLDLELFKGAAVSNATGLGGLTNGDVVRQGSFNISKGPYVARAYLRYLWPVGEETVDTGRGMDQLPGTEPAKRIEIKLGKFAANDDFDRNRYANSTRNQFENWSLWNNTAWDYPADTRGYTNGIMAGYVSPRWALRFGIFQMPTVANGPDLDLPLSKSRSENLELTLQPNHYATVVRLLAQFAGTPRAVRIYKTYGTDAVRLISENPYRLARDIRGIGFRTADQIAAKLGIEKTALIRVRAGISYALAEAMDEGHCGLPVEELVPLTQKLLEVPAELVEMVLPAAPVDAPCPHDRASPDRSGAAHRWDRAGRGDALARRRKDLDRPQPPGLQRRPPASHAPAST